MITEHINRLYDKFTFDIRYNPNVLSRINDAMMYARIENKLYIPDYKICIFTPNKIYSYHNSTDIIIDMHQFLDILLNILSKFKFIPIYHIWLVQYVCNYEFGVIHVSDSKYGRPMELRYYYPERPHKLSAVSHKKYTSMSSDRHIIMDALVKFHN